MGAATDLREDAEQIAASLPPHANVAAALVAALADLTVVEAARSAEIPMKGGGKYSYKYADIGDVVKLTRPVLWKHGLVALTPVHDHGDHLACTVMILHTSGDRLDLGPFPFKPGHDAQSTGSAVTYHRRYALVAALGMAAGDDDDGAAAKPRQSAPEPSAAAVDALASLNALPKDPAAEIRGRLEAKAGVPAIDALEDSGWREWLAGAIDHHNKTAGGEG